MVPPSPPVIPIWPGSPHCYDFSPQGLVPRRKNGCTPSNFVCWEPAAPIWEINRFLLKDVFFGKKIVLGDLIISTLVLGWMLYKHRKIVWITSPADMVGFMFLTELCQMQGFATCIHCEFANDATRNKPLTCSYYHIKYPNIRMIFEKQKAMGCSTCCHIPPGNQLFGCQGSINTFMEKVLMAFPTSGSAKKISASAAAGVGCFQDFGGNTS